MADSSRRLHPADRGCARGDRRTATRTSEHDEAAPSIAAGRCFGGIVGLIAACAVTLGMPARVDAQLITIDDFSVPQDRLRTTDVNAPQASSAGGEASVIVGGERDMEVVHTSENATDTEVTARVAASKQFILEGASQANSRVHLVWDGPSPPDQGPFSNQIQFRGLALNGGRGLDLTAAGRVDAVQLIVVQADVEYDLQLDIFQDDATAATFAARRPMSTGAVLTIPFSRFAGAGDFDFTDVGAIQLSAEEEALDLTLDFIRVVASVRVTMVDTVLDPEGVPKEGIAEPGDRIRYTVTVENPRDNGGPDGDPRTGFPSDPLTFTYDPLLPPNLGVTYLPESFTVVRGEVTPVEGHRPGDAKVEADIASVPDRTTDGPCPNDDSDPGCVVFTFEVIIADELPPGTVDIPGQGTIRTNNPAGPNPLTDVRTDDPNNPNSGEPDTEGFTPDENRTLVDGPPIGPEPGGIILGGGGCSTGVGYGGTGLALLIVVMMWAWRRRRGIAGSAVIAVVIALGWSGDARAQSGDQRDFSAERFTLSSDQDGVLDVESGSVIGHLNWDLGFWLGLADDPLAVYSAMDDGRERIEPFLTQRIGGDLVFAIGFYDRFQLGVQLPLILDQSFEFMDDTLAPTSAAGLGDIRLYPKVQLLKGDLDVAFIPVVTLPTAGGDSYFGEVSLTFAPMLAASRRFGRVTVAANVGYRARTNVAETLQLAPIDEVFGKLGVGYRVNPDSNRPLDVGLSVSLATAASDILGSFNRNASESVVGANYRVTPDWNAFAGVGAGLNPGFATPDWRVLAGLRFSRRAELPLCKRQPDHPDCLCITQPFHAMCPMDCDAHADDPRCPVAVQCPDNPPNRDHDCDGIDAPPWLLTSVGLPPDGPAFPTPEDKDAGKPPWERVTTGEPPPSISEPPGGGFPPETIERHDYCPGQPGTPAHHGCPAPTVVIPACQAGGVDIQVGPAVGFLAGSEVVDLPSRVPLEALAAKLKEQPDAQVSIEVGGDGANRELADKRAGEILAFLLAQGVDANNVVAIGYGGDGEAADDPASYPVRFRMPCPELPADGPCKTLNLDDKIQVQYEVNSDVIKAVSQAMLKRDVVWVLKAHPEVKIRVEGHTSSEGALGYNNKLSQRRAESVVAFLAGEGIEASRLRAVGYGPKYLLVKPERTEADREQNRRIEFLLTAGGSCPCETFKVEKVFFEYDSPVIKSESFPDLDKLVRNLNERPNVHLSIEGHTSSEGKAGYNKSLSARRAAAVRQYLIKGGIPAKRLVSRGWGEEKLLIKDDDTDDKKETNRRVEFIVTRGADDCLPR